MHIKYICSEVDCNKESLMVMSEKEIPTTWAILKIEHALPSGDVSKTSIAYCGACVKKYPKLFNLPNELPLVTKEEKKEVKKAVPPAPAANGNKPVHPREAKAMKALTKAK